MLRKSFDIVAAISLLVAVTWTPYIQPVIGKFEGIINPVIRDFTLTSIIADGPTTHIMGTFELLRADQCSFRFIEWDVVGAHGQRDAPAGIVFTKGSFVRDDGLNYFGPWQITMSADNLENHSIAKVFHRCHWTVKRGQYAEDGETLMIKPVRIKKPWLTITHQYPPMARE